MPSKEECAISGEEASRFLNADHKLWPITPVRAFAHIDNGTNMIYVDREHDLVAVVRWIDGRAEDGFHQAAIGIGPIDVSLARPRQSVPGVGIAQTRIAF